MDKLDIAGWAEACFGTKAGADTLTQVKPTSSCAHTRLGLHVYLVVTRRIDDDREKDVWTVCTDCGNHLREANAEDKHSLSVVGSL